MAASKTEITTWLKEGKDQGATHVVIVCDTYDWDDYPVFVLPNENVNDVYQKYQGPNMQKVMEVYNLSLDLAVQLAEHRAFNF